MPIVKAMLQVQYRMNPLLAAFPSNHFYRGDLASGVTANEREIPSSNFSWPKLNGNGLNPVVFISCSEPETNGASKANRGQVRLVLSLIRELQATTKTSDVDDSSLLSSSKDLKITVLTPYSLQASILKDEVKDAGKLVFFYCNYFKI